MAEPLLTEGLPVEGPGAPAYKVSEVARWFFGKSAHWLRWCERKGYLTTTTGSTIGEREHKRDARSYNLAEVEQMVRRLIENEAISPGHAELALDAVRQQAEIYGMFDDPYEHAGRSFPLTVDDVARMAGRSTTWVRAHALDLGGVRRQWDEGRMQESWRFPEDGMDETIYNLLGEA